MLLGAWAAALALLVMIFGRMFENERNPNRARVMRLSDDGVPQVVLERNRAGHYVATGSINGQPVRFLVDTGATDVALPLPLARQLNLPLREGGLSRTANGTVRTWKARLDRVDLGGLVATQVPASVLPGMEGEEVLLGMSYLKRLELIQRGRVLILRPHPAR